MSSIGVLWTFPFRTLSSGSFPDKGEIQDFTGKKTMTCTFMIINFKRKHWMIPWHFFFRLGRKRFLTYRHMDVILSCGWDNIHVDCFMRFQFVASMWWQFHSSGAQLGTVWATLLLPVSLSSALRTALLRNSCEVDGGDFWHSGPCLTSPPRPLPWQGFPAPSRGRGNVRPEESLQIFMSVLNIQSRCLMEERPPPC